MAWNFTNASAIGTNETNLYGGNVFYYYSIVVALVIVFLNSFAGIILMKSTKLPYQIAIMSMNLCICNPMIGILLLIPSLWFYQVFGCYLKKYILMTASFTAFLTVTLININLCCTSLFTFHYERLVSPRRFRVWCAISWMFGFILAYMLYYNGDPSKAGIACTEYKRGQENGVPGYINFGLLIFDFAMYGYLTYVTRKRRQVSPQINETQPNLAFRRNFSNLSVLTTTFLVLHSPAVTYFALCLICTFPRIQQVETCFVIIRLLTSMIDPFLYVVRFQECKYQLKLLVAVCNKIRNEEIRAERRQYFATYTIESTVRITHM